MARNRRGAADTPKHAAMRRAFAERVAQRMEELGLRQIDLAEALDCAQSSVSRWFRDGVWAIPEGIHMLQLGEMLRINSHWLMTGKGPRTLPSEDATDSRYADGARAGLTAAKLFIESELAKLNLVAPAAATPERLRADRDEAERRHQEAVATESRATLAKPPLRKPKHRRSG